MRSWHKNSFRKESHASFKTEKPFYKYFIFNPLSKKNNVSLRFCKSMFTSLISRQNDLLKKRMCAKFNNDQISSDLQQELRSTCFDVSSTNYSLWHQVPFEVWFIMFGRWTYIDVQVNVFPRMVISMSYFTLNQNIGFVKQYADLILIRTLGKIVPYILWFYQGWFTYPDR